MFFRKSKIIKSELDSSNLDRWDQKCNQSDQTIVYPVGSDQNEVLILIILFKWTTLLQTSDFFSHVNWIINGRDIPEYLLGLFACPFVVLKQLRSRLRNYFTKFDFINLPHQSARHSGESTQKIIFEISRKDYFLLKICRKTVDESKKLSLCYYAVISIISKIIHFNWIIDDATCLD